MVLTGGNALLFEVPEPTSFSEQPATVGQRLAARVLDVVLVGVVLAVTQIVLWSLIFSLDPRLQPLVSSHQPLTAEQQETLQWTVASWTWLSALVIVTLWFLYEVPLTALRGQTPGKMAVGIRVVTIDPTKIVSWPNAIGRWSVLGLPSALGIFGLVIQLVDCGWVLFTRSPKQCLHDMAARTHVITIKPRR